MHPGLLNSQDGPNSGEILSSDKSSGALYKTKKKGADGGWKP